MECVLNKKTQSIKNCVKCNLTVGSKNEAAHLKSCNYKKNYIDQTILSFRYNKT